MVTFNQTALKMTGGAGFSKNASNSFKENHNLGKVRERASNSTFPPRDPQDPEKLSENLDILNDRREQERRIRWLIPLIFVIVFVLVMMLATF